MYTRIKGQSERQLDRKRMETIRRMDRQKGNWTDKQADRQRIRATDTLTYSSSQDMRGETEYVIYIEYLM